MTDASVADTEPTTAAQPGPGHPLGTPNLATTGADLVHEPSIIDVVLDLDEVLSGDVRRAKLPARISTRGDLEGVIAMLTVELESLTDDSGAPLADRDVAVGGPETPAGTGRTPEQVAVEIRQAQHELAAAFRTVWMEQLNSDDWDEFETRHKKALDNGAPYPETFWEDLIVRTAVAPAINPAQLKGLRKKFGSPAIDVLGKVAWDVNTKGGVSVPKSQRSSAVLRRAARERS